MALIVKDSQIPGAGKGLFTTTLIRKGQKVVEYRGEIIDNKEYWRRVKREEDYYVMELKPNRSIDAMYTKQFKARYANDAAGISRVKGLSNNCDYAEHDDKIYIEARRDIYPGEEIFVNYTKGYWDSVRWRRYKAKQREKRAKERARVRAAKEKAKAKATRAKARAKKAKAARRK